MNRTSYKEIYNRIRRYHAPTNNGVVKFSLIKKLWDVNEKEILYFFKQEKLYLNKIADETYIIFPSISEKAYQELKNKKIKLISENKILHKEIGYKKNIIDELETIRKIWNTKWDTLSTIDILSEESILTYINKKFNIEQQKNNKKIQTDLEKIRKLEKLLLQIEAKMVKLNNFLKRKK